MTTDPASLRAENARLREALEPFAALAQTDTVQDALSFAITGGTAATLTLTRGFTWETIPAEIFDKARAALAGRGE